MQFLRHDAIPSSGVRAVYRNASWRGLFAVTCVMAAITAFTLMPKQGEVTGVAAGFAAAITLFFVVLTVLRYRDCQHPHNWIVRDTEEGLYFNLRPAVNRHLPEEYPTVLHVPARHVKHVAKVVERRAFPDRHGMEKHNHLYLEFAPEEADFEAARDVLHLERRLEPDQGGWLPHRRADYPFHVTRAGTLRVAWHRLAPTEKPALAQLGQHYPVRDEVTEDYPSWKEADDAGKEAIIADLWEQGHVEIAERLLRMHKGLSTRQARAWLDELLDAPARG